MDGPGVPSPSSSPAGCLITPSVVPIPKRVLAPSSPYQQPATKPSLDEPLAGSPRGNGLSSGSTEVHAGGSGEVPMTRICRAILSCRSCGDPISIRSLVGGEFVCCLGAVGGSTTGSANEAGIGTFGIWNSEVLPHVAKGMSGLGKSFLDPRLWSRLEIWASQPGRPFQLFWLALGPRNGI